MGGGAPQHTSTLTFDQENLAKSLGKKLQSGLDHGASIKPYPNPTVAPLSPFIQGQQSQIEGFNPGQTNLATQTALQSILGGAAAGGDLGESSTNQLYQNSIFNPMMHAFTTQVAPQIKQSFAGAGRSFSSEAGFAQQRALSDMNVAGQAQLSQAVFGNQRLQAQYQNDAMQRQLAGLSLAPSIASMPLQQISQQQQMLAPYQAQQQAQLDAAYKKWTTAQPYNNPYLSLTNQYIGEGQTAVFQPQVSPGSAIINALAGQAAGGSLSYLGQNAGAAGASSIASLLGIGGSTAGFNAAAGAGVGAVGGGSAAAFGAAAAASGAAAGGAAAAGSAGAADAFVPIALGALAAA